MKVAVSVVALLIAAFVASAAQAATVSCGQTLTHSTGVDNDLSGCTGNGLTAGADGITIDLQGHRIDGGPGANGIDFAGHSGVTVRNGTVRFFGNGANIDGDHNRLLRVTLFGNETGVSITGDWNLVSGGSIAKNRFFGVDGSAGAHNTIESLLIAISVTAPIRLTGGHDNVVDHVSARGSATGIELFGETNDTLFSDKVSDFDHFGILVVNGCDGTVVRNNTIFDGKLDDRSRGGFGVLVQSSSNTTVAGNHSLRNEHGFVATGDDTISFTANVAQSNDGIGFIVNGGTTGASLVRNTAGSTHATSAVTNEGDYVGIAVDDAVGTLLEQNSANHNRIRIGSGVPGGIIVDSAATGTQLLRNVANYNAGNGITAGSASTTLTGNAAARNTGFGILAVPGVTDGGGNHASGNAAGQCSGVFCG
jgi:Right handed beta helix region